MMQKHAQPKSRKRNFFDVKWMILSGSLVATLGFWGLFTQIEDQSAVTAAAQPPVLPPNPNEEANKTLLINLPPMPTLVSGSANVGLELAKNPAPVQTRLSFKPAPIQAPTKIFLGGAKPSARNIGPVVRTRSSR